MEHYALMIGGAESMLARLQQYLRNWGVELIHAFDEVDGLWRFYRRQYCLAIVDVSAIKTQKQSKVLSKLRQNQAMPVLALCDWSVSEQIVECFAYGANVCIPTETSPEVVARQCESLIDLTLHRSQQKTREAKDSAELPPLIRGDIRLDRAQHTVFIRDHEVNLRRREFQMLCYFLENDGITLTPIQISSHIWSGKNAYDRDISPLVSSLRRQIEPDPKYPRYILNERGFGYRFMSNYEEK